MMQTAVSAVIGITLLSLVVSHPTSDYRTEKQLVSDVKLRIPRASLPTKDDNSEPQAKQGLGMFGPFATALLMPLLTTFTNGLTSSLQSGLAAFTGGRTPENVEGFVVNKPESSAPYVYITHTGGVPSALLPYAHPYAAPHDHSVASPIVVPIPHPVLSHGSVQHPYPVPHEPSVASPIVVPIPHPVLTHGSVQHPYAVPHEPSFVPPAAVPIPHPVLTHGSVQHPYAEPHEPSFASPIAVPISHPVLTHGNVQHYFTSHQDLVPSLPNHEDPKRDVKCLFEENVDDETIKSGITECS